MKALKRSLLLYILTPIIGALAYVSVVALFEGGKELGEQIWRGYIIQVLLLTGYGMILGIILLLPLLVLIEKKVKKEISQLVACALIVIVFLTITYILYAGADIYTGVIISIFPALAITVIKYRFLCENKVL